MPRIPNFVLPVRTMSTVHAPWAIQLAARPVVA